MKSWVLIKLVSNKIRVLDENQVRAYRGSIFFSENGEQDANIYLRDLIFKANKTHCPWAIATFFLYFLFA